MIPRLPFLVPILYELPGGPGHIHAEVNRFVNRFRTAARNHFKNILTRGVAELMRFVIIPDNDERG